MIIMTILMMVLFFKVMGFLFRMSWGVTRWIFRLIGGLIIAGLMISFIGVYLLPVIAVVGLIVLATRKTIRG